MITVDELIKIEHSYLHLINRDINKILFFDIETTGFSPAGSQVYLIGIIYKDNENFHLKQWFADTTDSEKEIISEFMAFIAEFKYLVHYNGTGFDIPFIIKKCQLLNIPCDFSGIESVDIYKQIHHLSKLLKLENLKQKTVENFLCTELNIKRTDICSGGELIKVYSQYLSTKSDSLLQTLLLHNHDDVLGMTGLIPIINYNCLANKEYTPVSISLSEAKTFTGLNKQEVIIELALDKFLPKRISGGNSHIYFTACANTAKLSIEVYQGELKYFYSNYRDYYYLPAEDRSIHKSVAFYVDKDFRTKAKAANCYSKKTGHFLMQYNEIVTPYFKIEYHDKNTYFEYTEDFINSNDLIKEYCHDIFNKLLKDG